MALNLTPDDVLGLLLGKPLKPRVGDVWRFSRVDGEVRRVRLPPPIHRGGGGCFCPFFDEDLDWHSHLYKDGRQDLALHMSAVLEERGNDSP